MAPLGLVTGGAVTTSTKVLDPDDEDDGKIVDKVEDGEAGATGDDVGGEAVGRGIGEDTMGAIEALGSFVFLPREANRRPR